MGQGMTMLALAYVAVGGAVGAMCRYALMTLITRINPGEFPFHTLTVNVLGGFLMGLWIACMEAMMPERTRDLHLLLAVGVLGGFTTFSAFSIDVLLLFERGATLQGMLYVAGSVVLSVLAVSFGLWLFKALLG